jgi:hypothetical protein
LLWPARPGTCTPKIAPMLGAPELTSFAGAHCVRTSATSQLTKARERAGPKPALLVAPEAHRSPPTRAFADAVVVVFLPRKPRLKQRGGWWPAEAISVSPKRAEPGAARFGAPS